MVLTGGVPGLRDLAGLTWFFAHGSLMFSPGFRPEVALPARALGWERRFGQPSVRNWGRPGTPAPTCSLAPGEGCGGVALGVAGPAGADVMRSLVVREASDPMTVTVQLELGDVTAFTWRMGADWNAATTDELVEAAVRNIDAGGGPSGDAWDYVEGVAAALARHQVDDEGVTRYHDALARRLGIAAADG